MGEHSSPMDYDMFSRAENLAIRTTILINGASAIAILAFLGTIWATDKQGSIGDLTISLVCFGIGVMLGFLAALINYWTYNYSVNTDSPNEMFGRTVFDKWFEEIKRNVRKFTKVVMFLLGLSFVCFVCGMIQGYRVFSQPQSKPPVKPCIKTCEPNPSYPLRRHKWHK